MNTREQLGVNDPLSTIALIERNLAAQEHPNRLDWWHRIAAPPEPALTASLKEREAYRRGKYISNTLLAEFVVTLGVLAIIAGVVNHALLPNMILTFLFLCMATFFNKRGQVIVSGIIIVLVFDASLMSTFLAFPRLTAFELPVLDLLIIPELFAVSLLPPRFVFFDMFFHIIFIVSALTFLFPQDAELAALLHTSSFADALAKPIIIQVITAVVSYTWMRSVLLAADRADRATSIALLERNIAEQSEFEAEQKHQLESEIQEIIEAHRQISNGNFEVRIPLRQGNTLWALAGSLNNLVARLQRLRRESEELRQTNKAIAYFFEARNRVQNNPIPWQATGTAIDALAQQHNAFSRILEQQQQRR